MDAKAGPRAAAAGRGAYLARIMDRGGRRTTGVLLGRPDPARHLAGSEVGFQVPGLGVFHPPNLTPDPRDGLGAWSEADSARALRTGLRPDGRELAPATTWRSYAGLTEEDARAVASHLKSLPPVAGPAPHDVGPAEKPAAPCLAVVAPQG